MLALPSAASAILSKSPMTTESSSSQTTDMMPSSHGFRSSTFEEASSTLVSSNGGSTADLQTNATHIISNDPTMSSTKTHALEALAALASDRATLSENTSSITPHPTSSDEESNTNSSMPPPPPRESIRSYTAQDESRLLRELPALPSRTTGRLRSASNPEGMEKWDSYSRCSNDRQHFVLPSSILEEELASTRRVLGESGGALSSSLSGFQFSNYSYYDQGKVQEFTMLTPGQDETDSYSTAIVNSGIAARKKRQIKQPMRFENEILGSEKVVQVDKSAGGGGKRGSRKKTKSPELGGNNDSLDVEEDESSLEPEELLKRARTRLLEDLSEENPDGEKGVLTLPHSLSKYKEVYNKHGRIGIYTPAERAAIITKFNAKRARRVWNKKIRYNCRKNLADRRMRVKGRFVKRSVEAMETLPEKDEAKTQKEEANENDEDVNRTKKNGSTPPTSGSPLSTVDEENGTHDEEMPDIDDEEADFSPTDDMPYRRTRRYTIT